MKKRRGLILYAGIGGFRHGVRNFPGWEWTAVELDPAIAAAYKTLFPEDEVIVADAHEYLRQHAHEFDFIQSSPPCQTHSRLRYGLGVCTDPAKTKPLDHDFCDTLLWTEIIFLLTHPRLKPGAKWLIENVNPYYNNFVKFAPEYRANIDRHFVWSNCAELVFLGNRNEKNQIFSTKSKTGVIRGMSLATMKLLPSVWFDIKEFPNIKNKRQVLRNMFEPELAKYCFEFIAKGVGL